ncbi:hypothetical protein CW304_20640 [Bacillus sp. UFRGS-B20]|nr:hypothetical protein CW304_20640 [Bacillus sp. UFRGS-B20]
MGLAWPVCGGAINFRSIFGGKERWHKRGLLAYGGVLMSALLYYYAIHFLGTRFKFLMAIEGFAFDDILDSFGKELQELVPEEASESGKP